MIDLIQILVFFGILIILIPLLGRYMADVFSGKYKFALENLCYKIGGINPQEEMTWGTYTKALLWFNFLGFLTVLGVQLFQYYLPLNPQNFPAPNILLAINTAISFVTNTNLQAYAGETTLSAFTQMFGLTVQNFLSAATGLAVALALFRGLSRQVSYTIGNFWVDIVRSIVYIFLPLSIIFAIVLVSNGVVQSIGPNIKITTLENKEQIIPLGPVASQVAIKQLGTNGGGYFNVNSAHPFENPNSITNFLEMLAILLIPASLVATYGILIGDKRHGQLLLFVMFIMLIFGLFIAYYTSHSSMEGRETRFGIANDILWITATTASANGSVNSMIDSMSPLSGGIAMFNIMLDELIFGGVGVGLCCMIMFTILAVFLSGLMVGRTPEYLGKKIQKREIQWVMAGILIPCMLILIGTAVSTAIPQALESRGNFGPHGLSEIMYAFTSAAGNNGSMFAGLSTDTPYYNISLGIVMLLGRGAVIIPTLALAGLFAAKKTSRKSEGTFSSDTFLFTILLIATIIVVSALIFFPALMLGPIVEHFLMLRGDLF